MLRLLLYVWLTIVLLSEFGLVRADDQKSVTYDGQISAIFRRHCFQCHGESRQEAGLNLAGYAMATKGGSGGAVLVSGRSGASRLFSAITAEDAAERMPPDTDPLSPEQIALIRTWIETGLRENGGSTAVPVRTLSFMPLANISGAGPLPVPGKLPHVEAVKTQRPFPILALAASPCASVVAAAGYERIDFVDPASREVIGSIPFPEGEPHVLRFSRSGAVLLAAGGRPVQSGSAVLFDVTTGTRLAELGNETDTVMAADISADEQRVAIGGQGRVVRVFSTVDGSLQHTLIKHTDWVTSIAYSPDGKLLASADRVGGIHLWDAASGGVVLPLSEHKSSVRSLSWRSDSQVLVSCGEDGTVIWWDIAKGWPVISKVDAHPPQRDPGNTARIANGVLDAGFGPGGELVTCGRDQVIRRWSADGTLLDSLKLEAEADSEAAKLPIRLLPLRSVITFDGRTIVAGDSAGRIHSWQIESSQ